MDNVRMGWWYGVVAFLGGLSAAAPAQYFYEDPNQCGIGQYWYRIVFDSRGQFVEGQGWGYGSGWYYYPQTGVYRQWYRRGPYHAGRSASMTISAGIEPVDAQKVGRAEIRFIWAKPAWSTKCLDRPPLPDDVPDATSEFAYVDSSLMHSLLASMFGSAEPIKTCSIDGYSPDWVGIEVTGGNIKAMRWVAPQSAEDSIWDYGDAPDSYATSLDSGGTRHLIVAGICLGKSVDTEADAEPGYEAEGDDRYGDKDDGVTFLQPLAGGGATVLEVTASVEGYLNAWLDYNRDGTFAGADEQVVTRQILAAGVNRLSVRVPDTAAPGWTYARFRFSTSPWIAYSGAAEDGEVEDYRVHIAGECGVDDANVITLRESFDDEAMSRRWYSEATDPNRVWLDEVGGRLDLRATASAAGEGAHYVSSYWQLDTTADFALQVRYGFTPVTAPQAWLSLRLTPSPATSDANGVDFEVGSSGGSRQFRYRVVRSGAVTKKESLSRTADSGTLYLSYDAAADELYLSTVGYGRTHAWKSVAGLAHGAWSSVPLSVVIGGTVSGLTLDAGQASFDDLMVATGTLSGAVVLTRFWSATSGCHFYTLSESERRQFIDQYADHIWACEGEKYLALSNAGASGAAPVYRFRCPKTDVYFYTIRASEKDKLIAQSSKTWTFEGTAFYAFAPEQSLPGGVQPVYRFWSPRTGVHFYTMTESEKNKLVTEYPSSVWTYEGIAWYAYP